MTDTLTPDRRSWNMSRIKGKDTKPELQFRSVLHRAGYRFRLHPSSLPGKPDVVLPKYRTAFFVNGCFWHRHEGCSMAYIPNSRIEFWTSKFEATVARDAKKSAELRKQGWNVLTIWECEICKSPESVLDRFKASISEGT
jgi:DNA mismatch endonuclease, patch repair protein